MSDGPNDMAALEKREATDPRALMAASAAAAEARAILSRNAALVDSIVAFATGAAIVAANVAVSSIPGGAGVTAIAREVAALAIEEAARRARRG